jgi:hypothetical protein
MDEEFMVLKRIPPLKKGNGEPEVEGILLRKSSPPRFLPLSFRVVLIFQPFQKIKKASFY